MKLTFLTTAFLLSSVALGHPHPEADAKPIFGSGTSLVERAIGSICKAPEGIGKCANTSACVGITYNNLCPKDTADVKVLIPRPNVAQLTVANSHSAVWNSNANPQKATVSVVPSPATAAAAVPSSVVTALDLSTSCAASRVHSPHRSKIPPYKCKQYVINSGHKILARFPGLVKTVYCYANKPGEHGKGRALDLMVTVSKTSTDRGISS